MTVKQPLFTSYEAVYMKKNGQPPINNLTKRHFPSVRIKYRTKEKTVLTPDKITDRWRVWKI